MRFQLELQLPTHGVWGKRLSAKVRVLFVDGRSNDFEEAARPTMNKPKRSTQASRARPAEVTVVESDSLADELKLPSFKVTEFRFVLEQRIFAAELKILYGKYHDKDWCKNFTETEPWPDEQPSSKPVDSTKIEIKCSSDQYGMIDPDADWTREVISCEDLTATPSYQSKLGIEVNHVLTARYKVSVLGRTYSHEASVPITIQAYAAAIPPRLADLEFEEISADQGEDEGGMCKDHVL